MIHATFRRPLGGRQLMSKQGKIHFLTAYLEYLLDQGIKSEYYYLSDASRYLRFLLRQSGPETVEAFLCESAASPAYRRRLTKTLKKFYAFATQKLDVPQNPLVGVKKGREQTSSRSRIR